MAVSLREGRRPVRTVVDEGRGRVEARRRPGESVREVTLIGLAGEWAAGERVSWSGRDYRVESASVRPDVETGVRAYVHLVPVNRDEIQD